MMSPIGRSTISHSAPISKIILDTRTNENAASQKPRLLFRLILSGFGASADHAKATIGTARHFTRRYVSLSDVPA
jgi:hypothetical protein